GAARARELRHPSVMEIEAKGNDHQVGRFARAVMSVRRRSSSPLGLFFLGFCVLGAPLLAAGSLGCSNEAQASPPTVDAAEAADLEARTPPSIAPPASKPQARITQEQY